MSVRFLNFNIFYLRTLFCAVRTIWGYSDEGSHFYYCYENYRLCRWCKQAFSLPAVPAKPLIGNPDWEFSSFQVCCFNRSKNTHAKERFYTAPLGEQVLTGLGQAMGTVPVTHDLGSHLSIIPPAFPAFFRKQEPCGPSSDEPASKTPANLKDKKNSPYGRPPCLPHKIAWKRENPVWKRHPLVIYRTPTMLLYAPDEWSFVPFFLHNPP